MHFRRGAFFRATRRCLLGLTVSLIPLTVDFIQAEHGSAMSQETLLRANQATVGILEETQNQHAPEKQSKIAVRGTGVHLADGYILTARHAVDRHDLSTMTGMPKEIRILTSDLHELSAVLVGDSSFTDVVVYRIAEAHRAKLTATTTFASEDAASGMEVFTIGFPLGWGPTMAFGRLGNTKTYLQTVETRLLQADLSACSGNSGGGLFNHRGEIVGIIHAIIQTEKDETQAHCSRMTFAIPGILAERIVGAAIAGQRPVFSKLGILLTSVKDGTKLRMAVKDVGEPAKSAGIQKHDIILTVDDTEILDAADLKSYLIELTRPGQRVSVKVRRIDADLTFTVTLGGG